MESELILEDVMVELEELKKLTVLGAKKALTMNDVSMLTGLSKSHLYKLVCDKKIPYYKSIGGKITYFNREEIDSWLLAHRVPTATETELAAISHCVNNPLNQSHLK